MEFIGMRASLTIFFEGKNLTEEEIKEEVFHLWGTKDVEIYYNKNRAVAICELLFKEKRSIDWIVISTPNGIVIKHTRADIKYIFPFGSDGWIDIEGKNYKATFYTVGKLEKR